MLEASCKNESSLDNLEYSLLQHAEIPIPTPKKGEVLVKVEAVGINPIDYKIQGGFLRPFVPKKFPHVPGKLNLTDMLAVHEFCCKHQCTIVDLLMVFFAVQVLI